MTKLRDPLWFQDTWNLNWKSTEICNCRLWPWKQDISIPLSQDHPVWIYTLVQWNELQMALKVSHICKWSEVRANQRAIRPKSRTRTSFPWQGDPTLNIRIFERSLLVRQLHFRAARFSLSHWSQTSYHNDLTTVVLNPPYILYHYLHISVNESETYQDLFVQYPKRD